MTERNKSGQIIYCDASDFPLATYGHLLKRIRERQHISQIELAKRTNLSVSFISSVENGQSQSSIGNAAAMCNALNVPLSHVYDTAVQVARIARMPDKKY